MLTTRIASLALAFTLAGAGNSFAQSAQPVFDSTFASQRPGSGSRPGPSWDHQISTYRNSRALGLDRLQQDNSQWRDAQQLVRASGASCELAQASRLGKTERRNEIVEVVCEGGEGYILIGGAAPEAIRCSDVRRDGPIWTMRYRDNRIDECRLPANYRQVALN